MSKSIKTILAVSLVAFVAACAQQDDEVVVEDTRVVEQPVYTKY